MTGCTPNFFVIGAPKCGTTALYTYLGRHPNVYFPSLKEPGYFSGDFPGMQFVHTDGEYLNLFKGATGAHFRVGDASVTYLASQQAPQRIKDFCKSAKLIAIVRDPVEMIVSSHAQLLFAGIETEEDLDIAWDLQGPRSEGRHVPPGCIEPGLLQYAQMASNGAHLRRFLEVFPRSQILILTFDEFVEDTEATYLKILEFLDLPDDRQRDFQRVNQRKEPRSRLLTKIIHDRRLPFHHIKPLLKRYLSGNLYEMAANIYRSSGKTAGSPSIPPDLSERIYARMRPDIEILEDLVGPLPHWRR